MCKTNGLAFAALVLGSAVGCGSSGGGLRIITIEDGGGNTLGTPLMFTGTLTSDYDSVGRSFTNGVITTMGVAGNGTWTAAYLGP